MKTKTIVVGSTLWRIFAVIYCFGSTNAQGRFTNGFPKVLVLRVLDMNTNSAVSTRLIPEMSFTCNGTIVGLTVAGRQPSQTRGRRQDPMIQIWRQNSSQNVYYRTNISFAINDTVCPETSIVFPESPNANDDQRVWQCNLNATNQVPVQAGDILGLLLPPRNDTSFQMSLATASRGPTNYVLEKQELEVPLDVNLIISDVDLIWTSSNQELPQIAVQVESEFDDNCSKCVSGFPNMPVFDIDYRTDSENVGMTTFIIPDMNFTHPATIAGFIVARRMFNQGSSFKIQIWRQNHSQPYVYYQIKLGIITDKDMLCVSSTQVVNNVVLSCILNDEYQVSVEPGDLLGLELPQTDDDRGVLFTSGGPTNYVFKLNMIQN